MSAAIGPITVLPGINGESWFPGDARSPSEATRQLVDEATRQLVEECYRHALQLLGDNRERLERLATALLASETLDEHDAYQAAGIGHDTSRSALGALAAAAPLTPVDDAEPDIGRAGNQRPLLEPSASEV